MTFSDMFFSLISKLYIAAKIRTMERIFRHGRLYLTLSPSTTHSPANNPPPNK